MQFERGSVGLVYDLNWQKIPQNKIPGVKEAYLS